MGNEKYPMEGAYKAIQQAFMVLMMAAEIEGEFPSVVGLKHK